LLKVDRLVKSYESAQRGTQERVLAVRDVTLDAGPGQFLTLLGPSGCGKTTTLRAIAGLEEPQSGEINVGGRTVFSSASRTNVAPQERGLGMVFQSYGIWPHMNVFENAAFPLRILDRARRLPERQLVEKVKTALAAVELGHLSGRRATALSGGQQQRLALARALVMEPPVLLLDEPLSNLDARLRDSMRSELVRLQRELGVTAVYVTHDQVEALAMSDVIAVMNNGVVEQMGSPRDVYDSPASLFVAGFIGGSNFIPGVLQEKVAQDIYRVSTDAGVIHGLGVGSLSPGAEVTVSVRPEDTQVTPVEGPSDLAGWQGTVRLAEFLGNAVQHEVQVGELVLRARDNPMELLALGTQVNVTLSPDKCRVYGARVAQ
jgi:iron(III) transport system ATP-binding protein